MAADDAGLKRILWWLLAGSRGGENRARLLTAIRARPANANQLAERLDLDYKTVRHHLDVLMDNRVVMSSGKDQYGAVYLLTQPMEANWELFEEIWARLGQSVTTEQRREEE